MRLNIEDWMNPIIFIKRTVVKQQSVNDNCKNGKEVVSFIRLTGTVSMGLSLRVDRHSWIPVAKPQYFTASKRHKEEIRWF